MTDLLEEVIKHAAIANHDNELSSMVVLMVTKGKVPEMHMAIAQDDVHQMNTAADLLKMEILRLITYNTEVGGKRE